MASAKPGPDVHTDTSRPILHSRLWLDGCFDFFHHGHAGVLLQSRRLGTSLTVGLHSDASIAHHKGPTVMNLAERVAAVEACRFVDECVPDAPYVTDLEWVDRYGCWFVSHGDDVTSDAEGGDCYRFVKQAGRMKIVPRTQGISTTGLVGRMLEGGREHFLGKWREGELGTGQGEMARMFREYAAAPNGRDPYVAVYTYGSDIEKPSQTHAANGTSSNPSFKPLIPGHDPRPDQRIVYVDGGFDLFCPGHIAFLQTVHSLEKALAMHDGRAWFSPEAQTRRLRDHGEDYGPAYFVVGIHDDQLINRYKGANYPIMNMFERGLCVVQCRYVDAVVLGAPHTPDEQYLRALPGLSAVAAATSTTDRSSLPDAVYHGPTAYMPPLKSADGSREDPYTDAKTLGIFAQTPKHAFQNVDAAQIVSRILGNREVYEERQRKKGVKVVGEEEHWRREVREREAEERRRGETKQQSA